MAKQRLHYFCFNRRKASAILGALVLTGVMAMAVGTMLSTSNNAIRRSGEKIAYEEAYQTALAGTHITRAWLIDQSLISNMTGNNAAETKIKAMVQNATKMNQAIAADVEARLKAKESLDGLNLYVSESTKRYTENGFTFEKTLAADGRRVIYTIPTSPLLNLPISTDDAEFNDSLFSETLDDGNKNYVEWVRITTPGITAETSASLRECTFIIEAKGVSEYAGKRKERVVQQRLLVKPNKPADPLLSSSEALITIGGSGHQAMSSNNIHWGPVLSKKDIENKYLGPIEVIEKGKKVTGYKVTDNGGGNGKKANMAGMVVNNSGKQQNADGIRDTRQSLQTGVNGKIMVGAKGNSSVQPLFTNLSITPGPDGFDFFRELGAGNLGVEAPNGIDKTNLQISGDNFGASQIEHGDLAKATDATNPNGLFEQLEDGSYTGAFIQGSPAVDQRIDDFFAAADYDTLKQYAIEHNGYYVYENGVAKTPAGQELEPMSMPNSDSDPLSTNAPGDRILFVEGPNGTPLSNPFELPSFWKGIVYVNGAAKVPNNGATLKVRSPEMFAQFRATGESNIAPPTETMCLDGILIALGNVDFSGNGAVYGTIAATGYVEMGASSALFYNSANGEGRLKDTSKGPQPYNVIAGKLYEVKVPTI